MTRALCTIDLDAFAANVRTLRSVTSGNAQLWAVVKANAYGHGAVQCARIAVREGAARLCVATVDEARQLRTAGIDAPMLVLGPLDAADVRACAELGVAVTVSTERTLQAVGQAGANAPAAHIKVDTGMGRWGLSLDAAPEIARGLVRAGVRLEGTMTHFATADEADTTFMIQQRDAFAQYVDALTAEHRDVIAHAANSAATLRDSSTHFDAVRCGIALYGMSPTQGAPAEHGLRPVMAVESQIAEVRHLAPGESTGYARTHVARRDERIGLVPVGYADGLRRLLSNSGELLVRGRRVPIVGTISMDHVSIVLSDDMQAGDTVVLIGRDGTERITAEEHARHARTINYEITCGIATSPRLQRAFVGVDE